MAEHGAYRLVVGSGVGTFRGLRLPPGSFWQWFALDGPATMRINLNTGAPSGALEVLAAAGSSQVHVHPGPNVFLEFSAAQGARILVTVSSVPSQESR